MKIILDVDDVLTLTFGALDARFGPATDPTTEILEVMFPGTDLEPVLHSPEFFGSLAPVEGAAAGARWIVRQGHTVTYVSSRPPVLEPVTRTWLEAHGFPELTLHCLGREGKKAFLRTELYDLLIDDQLRYLSIAAETGRRAIALSNPWNADWAGTRVSSWSELRRAI